MFSKPIFFPSLTPSTRFAERGVATHARISQGEGAPIHAVKPDHPSNAKILIFSSILISFLGSLPPGTVNVVMVQQAVAGGYSTAFWFAAGSLIAEMSYVGISLAMMHRIMKFEVVLKMLQWLSLSILIVLAISSFAAAAQEEAPARIDSISDTLTPFFFGFLLMAVNPVQIPFWFGWSTVLFAKKILMPHPLHYALYVAGAGLGSMMGSVLFIFGGQFLFAWFPVTQPVFHWAIGGVFTLNVLLQARKMLQKEAQG